jgi:hypothetical protein
MKKSDKTLIERLLGKWGYVPKSQLEEQARNAEFQASLSAQEHQRLQRIVDNEIDMIAKSIARYVRVHDDKVDSRGYNFVVSIDYGQVDRMMQELQFNKKTYYLEYLVMGMTRTIEADLAALMRLDGQWTTGRVAR